MKNLWTRVVKRKYIDPVPLEEWIRNPEKNKKNSSVIWKATVEAFTMIEEGLAWKVGDGRQIKIGRDPWVGCNEAYALSPGLLRHLDSKGLLTLNQVDKIGHSTIWGQAWKNDEDLRLPFRWKNEWISYIQELHRSNVRLKDEPDLLMWAQGKTSKYSPKEGYSFLMRKKGWEAPVWWSKSIWKLKCPAKARILLWYMLKRKIPTWDILQARYLVGPGRCPLCKSAEETINHLFTTCAVSMKVWGELTGLLNVKAQWGSDQLEVAWRKWWQNYPEGNMRSLPLIFFWGIWLARNKNLFQDKETPTSVIAINCAAIYSAIPPPETKTDQIHHKPVIIQEGIPWAFFDGASQNDRAGAGLCIYLNPEHSFKASVGLGMGTNNFAELSALRLLLCWFLKKNIFAIQVFGDSLNVINWVNGTSSCQNQILKNLLEEIMLLKTSFNSLSLCHIYRDNNKEANQLSKAGLQQNMGCWSIEEHRQGQIFSSQQSPFAPPQ